MKKRILAMLLAVVTVFSMIPAPTHAASTLEEAMAEVNIYGNTEPLTWLTMNGSVKTQYYTYYVYTSPATGQTSEIPAYCVDPNLYGVPLKAPDASTPIKYSASETVSDPKVCGIIANGYPHIDLDTLGVNSVLEAYYATKTALWCYILSSWDVSKLGVNPNLSGADKEAAERVLAAAKRIYTRGIKWNKLVEPKLTAVPDRDTAYAATVNGESVYQQVFTVTSETWSIEPVMISLAEGAPGGAKILDMNNNEISNLNITDATEGNGYSWQVKVVYPKDSVEGQSGTAKIAMRSTVVQYAIYFAKTLERDKYGNIQEYMLDTDPHTPITGSAVSTYSSAPSTQNDAPSTGETALRIVKVEDGTDTPLAGATFEVKDPDGSSVGSFVTSNDGAITIPLITTGNYTVTETVPPENHLLAKVRTQNVTVVHGETATVTFADAPYGKIRVEKVSDTGEALKGVTVQIKHVATGATQSAQTNSAGVAEFDLLPVGGWEVRETAGIEGWQFDGDTVKTIAVTTGETSTVTFVNKELPGLRIVKYDRTSLQTMPDVTFEIFKDGTSIGRYSTDAMGEIMLTNAAPGTYLVKEVQSVDSHITDTTPQEIELKAGDGIRQLVFYNDKKPGIHLVKVDSANLSKPIANARFSIKAVDGSYGPEEFTTGADGTIDLSKLPTGAYVVTELSCPGYVIDEAQRIIQLDGNETAEFVFTNSIRPSIHIVKISSDGSPLPGVAFRIAKIEDGTSYLDRTTDQNGEILINDLDPGVYSVRETSTVADHVLDLREFHVELFAGRTSTLVVENQKRPNLIVYKHDADTGEAIADTVFQVKAADGHSIDEIKTDASGKAELYNLLPGVYEITEKSVPADWLMDAPSQLVTLYANRDHTAYFENRRKPTLTVNKVSSVTGKALEGAKFNVTYGSNSTTTGEINDLGTYYTDANGQFTLTRLKDGWYKVTELASVDGYQPADATKFQTLYVGGGDNAVMTFENVPLSAITVYKYDNVTGEAVRDAVFEVRYLTDTSGTGGMAIGRYKTGVNGSFTVTGLIKGTYVVEELASDSGHVIDTAPQTVFLSGEDQDVVQLYFGNTPNGSVLITKKDAVTLAPLSGVEFTVSDSNGTLLGSANGKFITDSAGTILIENLEPSVTVVAKETRTISGYILDNTPQTVKVQPGKTVTLEFLNQPKGNLVIRKFDSVTKQPLPGAEFKVTMANGELTPGNEGLTSSNGLYLTDENGQITLSKLTPATYVISETKAPDGYALDNQTQTVVVGAADTQTVSFYNEPLATLMLLKRDAVSKLPLANAEFTVKTADGTAIGTNNGTYTTDDTGTATVTGIQPNTVVVVSEDSAPAGYVANSTPKTIVVKSGVPNRLTFNNEPTTTLLIHKYIEGTNNEPLSGVGFRVTDSTGAAVGPNNGTYYTDRAGEIMLTGLAPGITVTAQEFKTVDGYVLDGTPQSVLIKDYQKMELTFWNAKAQTLTINKYVTGTTNPIQGVRFQVTASDGSAIGTNNGEFLTDRNGQIKIDGLTPGVTITAREIETVSGFVLDTTPKSIKIESGEAQSLVFYNQRKGGIIIEKRDEQTGAPLAGAEFRVTTSGGVPVDADEGRTSTDGIYVTNASGQIVLTNLSPDTYIITETKAPEGYVLAGEKQTVKVNANDTQTVKFTNVALQSVTIQKLVEGTNKPLAGVTFLVTDANNAPIGNGSYVTDENGQITLNGLTPGMALIIRETKTVKGYQLNSTPRTIVVGTGTTALNAALLHSANTATAGMNTVSIYDEPLSTLVIKKYIKGTDREPLEGVAFKVTDGNGGNVGPNDGVWYTNNAGEITIPDLETGAVITVREIATVDGYILDGNPKQVQIKSSDVHELVFWNAKQGALTFRALDSSTQQPIEGVTFKITTATGEFVPDKNGKISSNGLYKTDKAGEIILTGVVGNFVVSMVDTVSGYSIHEATRSQTIVVNPDDTQQLTAYCDPLQTLTVQVFEKGTTNPLAGIPFKVTSSDGKVVGEANGEYVSDRNGQFTITGIAPGVTITAQEVGSISGYVLNSVPQSILIKSGEAQKLTFFNEKKGTLIVKLKDAAGGAPIANAEFKITTILGAFVDDNEGATSTKGIYRTDENGEIRLLLLNPDTFEVTQLTTDGGHVMDSKPQTVKVNAADAQTVEFKNTALESVVIQKYVEGTTRPLAGVTFLITDGSGAPISGNGEFVTDKNGRIVLTGLVPGTTLIVKEIKTAKGYVLNTQPQTIVVGKTNSVTSVSTAATTGTTGSTTSSVTAHGGSGNTLTFYDDPLSTLIINKFVTGTTRPIKGVRFLITDSTGAYVGTNNGEHTTDANGQITLRNLEPGITITAKEIEAASGYVLDTTPKSIEIKTGEVQRLDFYNSPEGGLELIKVNASDKTKRIENVTFEIRRMDGGLVETVTTGKNGRVHVNLDAGSYYAVEIAAAKGYKLDNTPQYFEIKDGRTTTLTVANTPYSGIEIHKVDSVTGEGIYNAKFLLYDAEKHPVGEYVSDQNGYVYVNDLTRDGKYFIRELECEGYNVDTQMKTITLKAGEIIQIEWKNDPITGQIQVYKYAAEYNAVTGTTAGAPLSGAVYEIVDVRSGKVVDNITTDARGVAASKALPLKRYQVKEVTAPAYWQVDATIHDVTLEYPGQIIKLSAYDKPATLGVKVTKRGNASVMAGQQMKYTITVANTSNVALDNFFWHDRIPTDIAVGTVLTTGTYSARLNYRILYKTNYSGDYQVLASNLLTTSNYSFSLNAIPMQAGEIVTEILFEFGKVPVGFQSVTAPTLSVCVNGNAANGYTMVNRADAGGKYGSTWETGNASWATQIIQLTKPAKLPKTGY